MAIEGHSGGNFFAMALLVAAEEHFYFLFPPLIWIVGMRRTTMVCCALLFICPVIRLFAAAPLTTFAAYVAFPGRADSIAYGVLVAIALRATAPFSLVTARSQYLQSRLSSHICDHFGGKQLRMVSPR